MQIEVYFNLESSLWFGESFFMFWFILKNYVSLGEFIYQIHKFPTISDKSVIEAVVLTYNGPFVIVLITFS